MAQLDSADEASIGKLSPQDSLDTVQAVLEGIAERHGADWRDWPEWLCANGWPKLLAWAALRFHSPAYETLVAFGFKRGWLAETDPVRIPLLFEGFVGSVHALGMAASGGEAADEDKAAEQARRGIDAMFLALGPGASRIAYAAMVQALSGHRAEWLSPSWKAAMAEFERGEIGGPATKTGMPGRSGSI